MPIQAGQILAYQIVALNVWFGIEIQVKGPKEVLFSIAWTNLYHALLGMPW